MLWDGSVSDILVRSGFAEDDDSQRTKVSDTLVRSTPAPSELLARMQAKMDADLELAKRERAEAVWRKRVASGVVQLNCAANGGGAAKGDALSLQGADALTNEAMVAQVEARMAKLLSEDLHK